MTLRSDIERAMREHTLTSPFSTTLPPNPNRLGRTVRTVNVEDPDVAQALSSPGLVARLKVLADDADVDTRERIHELGLALRQFERAERGDRCLPGEWNGRDDQPYAPMPYAARETHIPTQAPGTEAHRVMKAAVDQLNSDDLVHGVAERMNTRSQVADIEAREDAREPTLRERVSAAMNVHTGSNPL